ncbi:uncharacterized protein LOC135845158 [Planococcus citri]|uniref:uncharacterized protein LOC135835863 n=1 Tax=Planococcus citri TaxID=170843 RepID=UPI0031F9876C
MTNAEQPNETSLNAMILELEMPKNSTVEPQMEPQMEPQAGPSSINLVPEPQIAEPQATGHHFVEVPRSNRTVDQFRFPLRHSYLKADGVTKGFLTHNDPRAMCVDYELGFNSPCMSTRCWFYNSHFWSIHKDLMETIKVRFEGGMVNINVIQVHPQFKILFPFTYQNYVDLKRNIIRFGPSYDECYLWLPTRSLETSPLRHRSNV